MRIIAGRHRGRTIVGPKDEKTTRPITDRVKETLFNRLHALGALDGGPVADVFCGTGSMGLEALSRGAAHCTFVDRDRDATQRLRENLDTLDDAERATVVQGAAVPPLWCARLADDSLSAAFVDPPFVLARMEDEPNTERGTSPDPSQGEGSPALPNGLDSLLDALRPKLTPGGVVVYRTDADTHAPELAGYDGPDRAVYGAMAVHLFQRPISAEAEDA
ncbi:MAG: RsmD family RNA methyltransferase [Planctomycetota bacterium]